MGYEYNEIQGGRKLSEMTEQEQAYIHKEWERLCARETINTSRYVFIQKPNGRFFKAQRVTHATIVDGMYRGTSSSQWVVRYGNCKVWTFVKNLMGQYDPEPTDKYFRSLDLNNGERVVVPSSVHTKKEVLELARKIGFEI